MKRGVGISAGWRYLVVCLATVYGATAYGAPGMRDTAAADRPNVIVILSDDQGWGDLSLNGNRNLQTPHIDSLAAAGAQFERFFVCPVCSPTRAEFLTGRYHPRCGVYSTSAGGERLDLDELTIADIFRKAGYATAAYGKWHNGMQYPYHPNARGFQDYYGFCSGHWGHYFAPPLEHNGRIVRGEGFVIDDLVNHALRFIEKNRRKPFFVYLPLNTPHSPMQVPERWWRRFKDKKLSMHHRDPQRENVPHVRAALAMCENIDWNVGRILKQLDTLQLADDTIVVYFCDNGPNGFRWNGGMKGRKGSTDEGGVRSPLLVRWPKRIPSGRKVEPIGAAIDLLPTLAALCEVPVASQQTLDGINLAPLLVALSRAWPDRTIFSHWRGRVSARTQQYRLDHQGRLYDMHADPGQMSDVAGKHAELASRLRKSVNTWKAEVMAELTPDQRRFPLGHAQFRYTQLPARDGKSHGNIKRSNRFPNCSFFTNWKSTEDKITWDVEVLSSGTYQVELYYTCPRADVGSTVELRFNEQRLQAVIDKAHDPPLRGAAQDRVKRTESYVKDFRPLDMGRMELQPGRGELTLQALEMPGRQVMDFRLLQFTRVEAARE